MPYSVSQRRSFDGADGEGPNALRSLDVKEPEVLESGCSRDGEYQKKVCWDRMLIIFNTVATAFLPPLKRVGFLPNFR
jgi:hypothetical protein